MKKLFILFIPLSIFGQTNSQNYTLRKKYKMEVGFSTNSSLIADMEIEYYDGLGRSVQKTQRNATENDKNLTYFFAYDDFGRAKQTFLPYPKSDLEYDPYASYNAYGFYASPTLESTGNPKFEATDYAYSDVLFDDSPLNRIIKSTSPGDAWHISSDLAVDDKAIEFDYRLSSYNEVKLYRAVSTWNPGLGLYLPSLNQIGHYGVNKLYKIITRDENHTQNSGNDHTSQEFHDTSGKLLLKRTYESGESHDTYYVYDQYGNLSCVMPPLSDKSASANDLDGLCYQYRYDYRNRLVEKKLPGKDWEFIIYDRLDRVVATGPAPNPFGNGTKGWLFTKYDIFNRPVYNGWYSGHGATSADRTTIQTILNGTGTLSESRTTSNTINNIPIAYTNAAFPSGSITLLGINYYDDYGFPGVAPVPTAVFGEPILGNVKGLSTGSWTRVLTTASQYVGEQSTVFYDGKARPVRSYLKNYLGGYTQSDSRIDFSGKTLYTVTEHKRTASVTATIIREDFAYTDQDRLLAHTHKINSNPAELLAKNEYDELGQLVRKSVGREQNNPLQKVDYSYNIRGWLSGINTGNPGPADHVDLFVFEIRYNNPESSVALYNGNISETLWQTASDMVKRKYDYSYDALNRLTEAYYLKHQQNYQSTQAYNEAVEYDKNGNITRLRRNGNNDGAIYIEMDNLSYEYDQQLRNRLLRVTDSSTEPSGFKDGTNTGDDYGYDDYGNMTSDGNKGIISIYYNHMNLPVSINFSNGIDKIEYLYDSSGAKLRKTVTFDAPQLAGGVGIKTMDYLTGFHYDGAVLKFFPTAEGYVNYTSGQYNYVYNYTDHLGNVRLSYGLEPRSGGTKIIEENHYYPFGMKHTNYNVDRYTFQSKDGGVVLKAAPVTSGVVFNYDYKFGGNEFQDELGLNVYDYDNRIYDQAIGRFWQMDPLAEQGRRWSPYNYCFDNPMYFRDPDGMWPWPTWQQVKSFGRGFTNTVVGAAKGLATQSLVNPSSVIPSAVKLARGDTKGAVKEAVKATGVPAMVSTVKKATNGDAEAIGSLTAVVTMAVVAKKISPTSATTATVSSEGVAVANTVPTTLARVVPAGIEATTLGAPAAERVFVTSASELSGLNATEIAAKLTIPESSIGFQIIEFPTPSSGIATPIASEMPGFVGGGTTAGGAVEFTIPNQPIPSNSTIRTVP